MFRRPGTCSPKGLILPIDPILDIRTSFNSCFDSMYACVVTLVLRYLWLTDCSAYVHWGFFSRSVAGDSDLVTVQFKVHDDSASFAVSN